MTAGVEGLMARRRLCVWRLGPVPGRAFPFSSALRLVTFSCPNLRFAVDKTGFFHQTMWNFSGSVRQREESIESR